MTALELFLRERITSLPLNPAALARQNAITLVTYRGLNTFCGFSLGALRNCVASDGFSFCAQGQKVIAYNDEIESLARQRWTLTHELCHFWLGHVGAAGALPAGSPPRRADEQVADHLTAALLCPLPVVHLCAPENAMALAALCGISREAADIRWRELGALRRAKTLMECAEDRALVAQFLPFISGVITAAAERRQQNARYRRVDILREEIK